MGEPTYTVTNLVRGSVVIVNVGIDIVVSKVVCIVVCMVESKVSDFVGKMSKVICDLAHFVLGVVSVPT